MKRTAIKVFDEQTSLTAYGNDGNFEFIVMEYDSGKQTSVLLTPEEAEEMAYYILRRSKEMKQETESGQQLS